jgi:hypothetical protein
MATKTLLDYTQDVLSALDSDEVNSITDTVESLQVVRIVRRCYESISSRADLNEHYLTFELSDSADVDFPATMYLPEDIANLVWVRYDHGTVTNPNLNMQTITFMPLNTFIDYTTQFDETQSYVGLQTFNPLAGDTVSFKFMNDKPPTFYTTFDNNVLVFDSYDSAVDTTLQRTRSQGYGKKHQTWLNEDSFIPFIDAEFSNLLLNESLATAFAELKQIPNELATKWAIRHWNKVPKAKRGIDNDRRPLADVVNYGRRVR